MDLFNAPIPKLQLRRPLAFFDLETTGVDFVKDRIVEISILRVEIDGSEKKYTQRLNPTIPIPIEASAVHGIYDEDVIMCPTFKDVAQEIFDLMNPCDLAGFNSNRFDIPVILEEFMRVGIEFDIENRSMVDVHRIYTLYEKRTLEAAYFFYCNKLLENAHSAEADTQATYEVLVAQIEKYDDLKNDVRALHDLSNEERIIDSGRRFIFSNGKPTFNFGKYKGKSVEEVLKQDPGYYSWMMQGDFPLHTKQKLKEMREKIMARKTS